MSREYDVPVDKKNIYLGKINDLGIFFQILNFYVNNLLLSAKYNIWVKFMI